MKPRVTTFILAGLLFLSGSIFLAGFFNLRKPLQEKYIARATTEARQKNFKKANLNLAKAELLGGNPQINALKGEVLFYQERYGAAISYLEKSSDVESKKMLGLCYFNLGRYALAAKSLEAINNDDKSQADWEHLITSYLKVDQTTRANKTVLDALNYYPDEKNLAKLKDIIIINDSVVEKRVDHYLKSAKWLNENYYDQAALSLLEKSIAIMPQNRDSYLLKGEILFSQGQAEDAQLAFKKAENIDPFYCFTSLKLAETYEKQNNASQKEKALKRAALLGC